MTALILHEDRESERAINHPENPPTRTVLLSLTYDHSDIDRLLTATFWGYHRDGEPLQGSVKLQAPALLANDIPINLRLDLATMRDLVATFQDWSGETPEATETSEPSPTDTDHALADAAYILYAAVERCLADRLLSPRIFTEMEGLRQALVARGVMADTVASAIKEGD